MRASSSKILIIADVQNGISYENILRRNNFSNVTLCKDPITGLQKMEHEAPHILIMDAEMPDIDGYELAGNVREIEKAEQRFTYIILVSKDAQHESCEYATQANVDSILSLDQLPFRLAPQVMSGERVSLQTNALLSQLGALKNRCGHLEEGQLLDPLTGLGNRRQAMRGLDDTIRQIEARGGCVALLLIKIMDIKDIKAEHGEQIAQELTVGVGEKVRRLVRPLDIVTFFDEGTFAIIMQHESLEHCKEQSYQRFLEGLSLKSYQTRAGYLTPEISIGVCGATAETGPPKTGYLVATAMSNLTKGEETEKLKVTPLDPLDRMSA